MGKPRLWDSLVSPSAFADQRNKTHRLIALFISPGLSSLYDNDLLFVSVANWNHQPSSNF